MCYIHLCCTICEGVIKSIHVQSAGNTSPENLGGWSYQHVHGRGIPREGVHWGKIVIAIDVNLLVNCSLHKFRLISV